MTTDAPGQPNLTERQERILELIVRAYTQHGDPISSKSLVEHLDVSSATIRNEMVHLEEVGLIQSPHTSAGRIPTQDGYRYFVQRLLHDGELSLVERRMIAHQFHQAPLEVDQWLRLAAAVLARTAQNVSLVTAPRSEIHLFKHLELIETQGRLVLLVLVLMNGDVRQRMLTLAESVTQDRLSEAAARITHQAMNLTADEIREKGHDLPLLEQEVLSLVIELMREADHSEQQIAYHEGLGGLLERFNRPEGAQQALRVLEEQTMLEALLSQEDGPAVGNIRVVIAGEGQWEEINLLSIVLGRYGVMGRATGMLGVLGPTRMSYGRAISAVRYVADLMTSLLIDVYGTEPPYKLTP